MLAAGSRQSKYRTAAKAIKTTIMIRIKQHSLLDFFLKPHLMS